MVRREFIPEVHEMEVESRANDAWALVKSIFPFINDPEDFQKYSVDNLVKNEKVKDYLGKVYYIQEGDAVTYMEKLQNMVATVEDANTFQLGGLVIKVQVYVQSDILKNGVSIVDLSRCIVPDNRFLGLTTDQHEPLDAVGICIDWTKRPGDYDPVSLH